MKVMTTTVGGGEATMNETNQQLQINPLTNPIQHSMDAAVHSLPWIQRIFVILLPAVFERCMLVPKHRNCMYIIRFVPYTNWYPKMYGFFFGCPIHVPCFFLLCSNMENAIW